MIVWLKRGFYFYLTVVVLAVAGYSLYVHLTGQSPIYQWIAAQIERAAGDEVVYDDLAFNWTGVELRNVTLIADELKRKNIGATAEKLIVSFQPLSLFRRIIYSDKPVFKISLLKPVLTIGEIAQSNGSPDKPARELANGPMDGKSNEITASESNNLRASLIRKVSINQGTVIINSLFRKTNGSIRIEDITGWANVDDSLFTQIALSGNIANLDKAHLMISTNIDLRDIVLDSINFEIDDMVLQSRVDDSTTSRVTLDRGALNGWFSLPASKSEGGNGLRGQVELDDARISIQFGKPEMSLPKAGDAGTLAKIGKSALPKDFFRQISQSLSAAPLTLDSVSIRANILDDVIEIISGRQLVNSQPMDLWGSIDVSKVMMLSPKTKPGSDKNASDPRGGSHQVLAHPVMNIGFRCDTLIVEEFLRPVLQQADGEFEQHKEPFTGIASLHGTLEGAPNAPRIEAFISAPQLSLKGRIFRQLAADISYGEVLPSEDDLKPRRDVLFLRGRGKVNLANSKRFAEEERERLLSEGEVNWEGWGQLTLTDQRLPIDMTMVVDGQISSIVSQLIEQSSSKKAQGRPSAQDLELDSFLQKLPDMKMASVTSISGPILHPRISGEINLEVTPKGNPNQAEHWYGNFEFSRNALQVNVTLEDEKTSLSAQILELDRQPLFKIRGMEVQAMRIFAGQKNALSFLDDLDIDVYLEGRIDSLNIRFDGRKQSNQKTYLQAIGYMLPSLPRERIVSGYVRFLPDMPNEFAADFVCHLQDSTLKITEFRCEDWLTGSFEAGLEGENYLKGNIRISGAELARLTEGLDREKPPYRGKLFGEVKIEGQLKSPLLDANFWIMDGVFNGIGSFAVRGNFRGDRSGWLIDSLKVSRNHLPYLTAAASYNRRNDELELRLQSAEIKMDDFLRALADVDDGIVSGRARIDAVARGSMQLFQSDRGIPLAGSIDIADGELLWFKFDSLRADLRAAENGGSSLARDKIRLGELAFVKQRRKKAMGELRVHGRATLPFDESQEVDIAAAGEGSLLSLLPDVSAFFERGDSQGDFQLKARGPYPDVTLYDSQFRFRDGELEMTRVVPRASEITGNITIDSRGTFVKIAELRGKLGGGMLAINNTDAAYLPNFTPTRGVIEELITDGILPFPIRPLRLGGTQLDLGILFLETSSNGLLLNIPGLMKENEKGRFRFAGKADTSYGLDFDKKLIVMGPWEHPVVNGSVELEGVSFQFPFDENSSTRDTLVQKVLYAINWDVLVKSRKDNRYVISTPKALNDVYVNLGIDDSRSWLNFSGILGDSSLVISGQGISNHGTIQYLDLNFNVNEFGAEFDKSEWWPIVYGSAQTVVTDSTNFPYNVYLTLYTKDPETGQDVARGRFHEAFFRLTSDHQNFAGQTQEQVLAYLGYSAESVTENATDVVISGTTDRLLRPLILRPVERELERTLGLDVVRLNSSFARNYLISKLSSVYDVGAENTGNIALNLLRDSRLTLGKYLVSNLYLLYVGQFEAGSNYSSLTGPGSSELAEYDLRLQLRHRLGLEYRLSPEMLLHFEYDYNPLLTGEKTDRRIWLRHSFPVDFPKEIP